MKNNPDFSIEKQYQYYLQRVNLKESEMHPEQKKQLKQAFFGASGQIILLLRDKISRLNERDAVEVLHSMINQVANHFTPIENKN